MTNKMQPLAVTATTLLSPCGAGSDAILNAMQNNRSGLAQSGYPGLGFNTWLGRVAGIETHAMEFAFQRYACRNNRLASQALGLDGFRDKVSTAIATYGANRIGVFVGTSTSGIEETEIAYREMKSNHQRLPESYDFLKTHNIASLLNYVRLSLGLGGPGQAISTACSSSAKVFAAAHRHISCGLCDAAVVGGVDSLCLTTLYGFNSLQLVSGEICRPFDAQRNGINIGEAAGFVLLEKPDHGRGMVKLKGYGESSDAYHMSSPHPDGEGAALAMHAALQRADLSAQEIDYVNLHGTATPSNDAAEGAGVSRIFGQQVACSSTKGYTGHTLGAAGITEAIISILALKNDFMPGTLNLQQADEAIAIRPLQENRAGALANVMSNNFGFGGSNCSLIFGW
ncbi:MAG: beta-ketoacyl-[acyl-carrier-protein] synthase family protein [Gammaproteobacteria bacterium]